jgi:hypothetical protein
MITTNRAETNAIMLSKKPKEEMAALHAVISSLGFDLIIADRVS